MNISIEFISSSHRLKETPCVIQLGYREIYQQRGDLRGLQIIPIEGQVWVTQLGDPEDHILGPGERFTITKPGRVVVQGMNDTRFRFA